MPSPTSISRIRVGPATDPKRICARAGFVLALVIILAASAPAGSGAPAPEYPFGPGTTWTYRHTVVKPGETYTGTMKEVYGGQIFYRGRTHHYVDTSYVLTYGSVDRAYHAWTGGNFRQAANVATDAQHNVVEIIFDKPFGLGVSEIRSGTAQIFRNGTQKAVVPWSFVASLRGSVRVTVPAGTFYTTRWETVFKFGEHETVMSIYTVGITAVRMDSKEYVSGSHTTTTYRELVSGPVDDARSRMNRAP